MMIAVQNEAHGVKAIRTREYWLASAYKRLVSWRKLRPEGTGISLVRRGLVRFPTSRDVKLMLSVATANEVELRRTYRRLLLHYRASMVALDAFTAATNHAARRSVATAAAWDPAVPKPFLSILRRNTIRLRRLARGQVAATTV